MRALFLVMPSRGLPWCMQAERFFIVSSSYKGASPIGGPTLLPSSDPNYLPKSPPPNTITCGGLVSTKEFVGGHNRIVHTKPQILVVLRLGNPDLIWEVKPRQGRASHPHPLGGWRNPALRSLLRTHCAAHRLLKCLRPSRYTHSCQISQGPRPFYLRIQNAPSLEDSVYY